MNDIEIIFQEWQPFYSTIAGVTATLLGLLFVAISLNMDVFSGENMHYRRLARLTLGKFLYLLVISLVCVIPSQGGHGFVITTVIMCITGIWDTIAYIRNSRKQIDTPIFGAHYFPLLTYFAMIAFAVLLLVRSDSDWLYWFAASVIVMLISATRNAWDLMVKTPKT